MFKPIILALALLSLGEAFAEEIVVYSARKKHLLDPVVNSFTKETGIKVKTMTDKAPALLQRLVSEGKGTKADVFITVDAGNLWHAAETGLLKPLKSKVLDQNIPSHLMDPEKRWVGVSVRARTIVYNTKKVNPKDIGTYSTLNQPKWRKRLCLRTSKKVYNQSLVATMIAAYGEPKTEEIVKGWVGNLAAKVFSNDTQVLKAVGAGQCDLGIVNTYYYGRLMREQPKLPIKLYWPKDGVHVNVSGAGVVKYAKNPAGAKRFIEWLSQKKAQKLFADLNLEFPANPNVKAAKEVQNWGTFKQNKLNVSVAGKLQAKAIKLMDRANYR